MITEDHSPGKTMLDGKALQSMWLQVQKISQELKNKVWHKSEDKKLTSGYIEEDKTK